MKSFTKFACAIFLFAAVSTSATFGLQETKPDKTLQSFEGDWVIDTVATKSYWKEQLAAGTFEMPPSLQQESESTKEYYLKNGSNVSASHVCFSLLDGKATINAAPSLFEVFKKPQKLCRVSPSEANLPDYEFCWKDKQLICKLSPRENSNPLGGNLGPFVMQKSNQKPIPKRLHGTWVLDRSATEQACRKMFDDGLISRTTSLSFARDDATRIEIIESKIFLKNSGASPKFSWNHRISRNKIFANIRHAEDVVIAERGDTQLAVKQESYNELLKIYRRESIEEKKQRKQKVRKQNKASENSNNKTDQPNEKPVIPESMIGEWAPDFGETERYLRDQANARILEPEYVTHFLNLFRKHAFHIHIGKSECFLEDTKKSRQSKTVIEELICKGKEIHLDGIQFNQLADDLIYGDIGLFFVRVVFKKLKASETRCQIPTELRSLWQFNPEKTRALWKQLVADEKLTQTYFDLKWDQIESQFRDIRFSKYELSITLNRLLKEQEQILRPLHVNSRSKENVEITFVGNEKTQTKFNSKNEIQVAWKDNVAAPLIYDRLDLQMLSTPEEFIGDWQLNIARSLKLQEASDIDVNRWDEEESFFDKLVALQIDGEKSNIQISSDSVKLESQNCTFDVFSISRARNGMFIGVHCKTLDLGPELIRMEVENFDGKRMIVASENSDLRFVFNRTSKISAQVRPGIPAGIIGQWKFDKTASQKLCSDLIKDGALGYVPYTKLGNLWLDVQGNVPLLLHRIGYPYWMQHMDNTELSIDSTTLTTNLFTSSMTPSRIKSIRTIGNAHHLILTYGERMTLYPINDKAMIISYVNVFQPSQLIQFVVKRKSAKK